MFHSIEATYKLHTVSFINKWNIVVMGLLLWHEQNNPL